MNRVLVLSLILLFSCKSKEQKEAEAKEKAKQEAQAQVDKIAAPMIATIVGNFNILIETAKNQNLPYSDRIKAISDLRANFCEFMCEAANLDSVYTVHFDNAAHKQRELIEAKCRESAAKQVYINALQKQYENY